MSQTDTSERYCVIGAGPCGLAAAKNFLQAGLAVDCYEQEEDAGGNWNFGKRSSSVYASTHLISSKKLTQYTDFPMPEDYPHYPSHQQVLEYLRSYARHFHLYEHIRFGAEVEKIEPVNGSWRVQTSLQSESRMYRGVVIANGHHWDPLLPSFAGEFSGQAIHAKEYKSPEVLRGRRVLVVGGGNSGCDIAVEAAQHAEAAFLSLRRGYHFLPKFLLGRPIDLCGHFLQRWGLPLWLRRWLSARAVNLALGRPQAYGLPAPDHKLFETHPIVNSQLLYYAGHGAISVRPQIASLRGDAVEFVDGRREQVDLIIYATGYRLNFPFIEPEHLNYHDGWPRLFLNAFHPHHDHLFVAGMIQPNSGIWRLADWQSQLMAAFVVAARERPRQAEWFRRLKRAASLDLGDGIRYVRSPRHAIEVEYYSYAQRLKRLIRKMR